jgi:NAD(P)H-dependent FMN reductase
MPKLGVIVGSVREGRLGLPVAQWFVDQATRHGGFDVQLIDLKDVGLPLLEEPHHPRLQKYTDARTAAWAATVKAIDAFVIVTPEYNYNTSPALLNALDHVYLEWNYKAVGFLSYGGISGGMRAVQVLRQFAAGFKMVPVVEAVPIPFAAKLIENGVFKGGADYEKAATVMLDEIAKWEGALRTLRG